MKKCNVIEEITISMRNGWSIRDILTQYSILDYEQTDRDGRTLLINAAFYGRTDIVEWLVKEGANVNASDKIGNTALHASVQESNISIIRILLLNGASVNKCNNFGNSPLWIVKPNQPKEIIEALLIAGADPEIKNNFGISAKERMAAYPEILRLYESSGSTD